MAWRPDDRNTLTWLRGWDRPNPLEMGRCLQPRLRHRLREAMPIRDRCHLETLLGERGHSLVTVHHSENDYRYDLRDRLRPGAAADSVYFADARETETACGACGRAYPPSLDLTWGGELRHVTFRHGITAFADTAQEALPTASPAGVHLITLPRNSVRRDDAGTKGALFASLEKRWGAWTATGGLRWDGFDYGGQRAWSPRGGLTWRLRERWTARGSAGVFYQTPAYVLLTRTPSARTLPFARASHYVLGADVRMSRGAQATIEAYAKSYRDLPVEAARGSHELVPEGRGEVRGLELFVQQRLLDRWYGLASYSWSRSERTDRLHGTFRDDWDYTHVRPCSRASGRDRSRALARLALHRWAGPSRRATGRFEVTPEGHVNPVPVTGWVSKVLGTAAACRPTTGSTCASTTAASSEPCSWSRS